VRAGYREALDERMSLRIYWEKRSFYFDEGSLPNLYTWVRTFAAELFWQFE